MRRAAALVLLAACARRGDPPGCVPGASQACACVNGWSGAQSCLADRTFEPCVCAGPARVEAADAAVAAPDAPTAAARAPVAVPRAAAQRARVTAAQCVRPGGFARLARGTECVSGCWRWCSCDSRAPSARVARQTCDRGRWGPCAGEARPCNAEAVLFSNPRDGYASVGADPTSAAPGPRALPGGSLGLDDP